MPPEPRALSQGRSGLGRLEIPDEGPDWGWRPFGGQDSGSFGRARGLAQGLSGTRD